jgi:cell wall-associated NlpC family hydrolase
MKKIFLLFISPVIVLLSLLLLDTSSTTETAAPVEAAYTVTATAKVTGTEAPAPKQRKANGSSKWYRASDEHTAAAPLVSYALTLIGSPYVYGGINREGFDCSGFIYHVYREFDVPVTRSSTTQAEDGVPVDKAEAQPGDLVIFTGTDQSVREPGHVGIVISEPGDTISFVHSSSNGGVKISQVEGTGYDDRFLEIRRVL